MKKISVPGGEYIIEPGIIKKAAQYIKAAYSPGRVFILSDENVYPLWADGLLASLEDEGIEYASLVLPSGEGEKNLANFELILNTLAENNFGREDVLAVLGGGVMGDLGAFAASAYKRGMGLVQIPTSLLAMVDSSLGGKTAVNLSAGKNLAGSFYKAGLILCDTDTLKTLPEREYRCGCAEIIKYAVLFDEGFFDDIYNRPVSKQAEHAISVCVRLKASLVEEDEFDRGRRRLLNLGHSFGHAVEKLSGYSIPHGEAVAVGMAAAVRCAGEKGICSAECRERLLSILDKYALPTSCTFGIEEMFSVMLEDKKASGDKIALIIPEKIGKCRIQAVPFTELREWLYSGGIR